MAAVTITQLCRSYGDTPVLRDVSLDIADGELLVLVGPSGCGKSTLLRCCAGLDRPRSGSIAIDGREVTSEAPRDRDIAMVFQSYALYPHLSVRENLGFALKMRKTKPAEIAARVAEAAQMLGLEEMLDRRPGDLSGGQRQRVAMGRAVVRRPKVFLFDEPLSNLDAALRGQMRIELLALHRRLKATMIYVTHDQVEAMTLADRIAVLDGGRLQQVATPAEIYARPANVFVARFIGAPEMNVLPKADAVALGLVTNDEPAAQIGVRPEDVLLTTTDQGAHGTVEIVEQLGWESLVHVELSASKAIVIARSESRVAPAHATAVRLAARPDSLHRFGADGQRCA